jgi:hypothetical protein
MASVFTSWKEISEHLGKGVRTVQRWEAELGLPVHRTEGGSARTIFAIPEELDAWARSHPRVPAAAIVGSLEREIAVLRDGVSELREQIHCLRDRLNDMERARFGMHASSSGGKARNTDQHLRDDLQESRRPLRETIGRSQARRRESQAAREETQRLYSATQSDQRPSLESEDRTVAPERRRTRARITSAR